jgi:hypothetical protein
MGKTPMAEGAHDLAGGFAREREPVFVANAVRTGSLLDNSLLFQLPQPFHEQRARRGTPRWMSLKVCEPNSSSRTTSGVHLVAKISDALATGQNWP